MAQLYMQIEALRAKKAKGLALSQGAERALKRDKDKLREKLGAEVVYPEEQIAVTMPHLLLQYVGGIRHLEEFRADSKKAAQLFRLIRTIFSFPIALPSIRKYYYGKEED